MNLPAPRKQSLGSNRFCQMAALLLLSPQTMQCAKITTRGLHKAGRLHQTAGYLATVKHWVLFPPSPKASQVISGGKKKKKKRLLHKEWFQES